MNDKQKQIRDEAPKILKALRDLMEYTGGWDSPKSHPCGRAARLLERLDKT